MVKLDRIYTRGGDGGQTSLVGGARVSKAGARIEAIGAVDEANAAIGLAAVGATGPTRAMLLTWQNELFDLGADLATPLDPPPKHAALRITPAQTTRLEGEIDEVNDRLPPLDTFILPGGTELAARLHLARTAVRRAERAMIALAEREPVNPDALAYVNRLSDLIFVICRVVNQGQDIGWQPGATRE